MIGRRGGRWVMAWWAGLLRAWGDLTGEGERRREATAWKVAQKIHLNACITGNNRIFN